MVADPQPEDYYSYIPESRLCHALGCTLQSTGFTRVGKHAQYPALSHPQHHLFSRRKGRVLQAYQIVFLSEGRGRAELGHGSKPFDLEAGMVFVLFPNVWHRYAPEPATGWTEHWVECKGTAFDMAVNSGLLDKSRPVFRNPDTAAIAATFAEIHSLARANAVGNQPVLSMLGLKLLAILAGPRTANEDSTNRLVNTARMMLLETCTENRPMEEIADALNVSYSNLRRRFRGHTGLSMKEYQTAMRLQKAKDLLDNTDLSIKGVAAQLGFSSAFHFSNQFRRTVRCPPTDWRARLAAGREEPLADADDL
ncbi:helix-turn-helix domain-containing protein [Pseudoruegeria sp. SHC-113]|uniref:helix-turn-helix domain-containing protein n=1 Tax=Pseudoruegeria sp. SHC-113 TaxID=2855439 RepID=UPI0021BA9F40|nr:AraC family transcriptional regulator [Pseudoruegeria sp. SHC-113]MCT8160085.1 AraC family transcriptional regulator [Pseudoruegeria sp. SHC-113]